MYFDWDNYSQGKLALANMLAPAIDRQGGGGRQNSFFGM